MAHRFVWNGDAVKSHLEAKGELAKKILAEYVAQKAFEFCPVDTGALSQSIGVVEANTGDAYMVVVGMYYAPWVEFGHTNHWTGGWVPGRFFLTQALHVAADAWPEIAREAFNEGSPTPETRGHIGVVFV